MDARPLLAVIVIVAGLGVVGTFAGGTYCYFSSNVPGNSNGANAWVSDNWSESTTAEFNAGVPVDVDTAGDQVILTLSPPPTYVYALQGDGTTAFWRYDIAANTWSGMAATPSAIGAGGALVYTGGDYIYALRGGGTRNFYRYSISADSWTTMAITPSTVGAGGSLAFDGTYIYALRGGAFTTFWRYSISGNSWTARTPLNRAASGGAGLAFDGGTGIYATTGGQFRDFYRYTTPGGPWSWNPPADISGSNIYFTDGAAIASNGPNVFTPLGATRKGANKFAKYTVATNSWSYKITPFSQGAGGALTYDGGGYLYEFQGGSTTGFWRYNIAGDTWAQLHNAPGTVDWGGSLVYVPATSSTCYSSPGSLASIVFDTTTVNSRWDMLAWTASIPPGTGINFEVRASNTPFLKDATLPAWTPVTGSFVNGKYVVTYPNIPSGRYEQWRATLTSSTCSSTPVLSDVTVYYSDWVTPIEGMSGLTFLATGFASRVNTTPGGAFVPVEIPSGIVDPNSLLPEPTETPTLIAGANGTNASETPVPMDALAALNATVNATQTAATLIPVNVTTVPIDTRAANVTANLTPAANATETPVPTATMAPNATANVTQPATMIPTPDVTAIPIQTVATTVIPTAIVTTMPTATPTTMAPLTLLEVASTDRNLTTFVKLTRNAGLDLTLEGLGPYTVFAPTDDAFRALSPSYLAGLLADPAALTRVLNRHVADGGFGALDLARISKVRMLDFTDVNVTELYGVVKVGGATVNYTDTLAGNGVIHVIDAVILPVDTPAPRATTSAAPVTTAPVSTPAVTPTATVQAVVQTSVVSTVPTSFISTVATPVAQTTAPVRTTPTLGKHYLT